MQRCKIRAYNSFRCPDPQITALRARQLANIYGRTVEFDDRLEGVRYAVEPDKSFGKGGDGAELTHAVFTKFPKEGA